MATVPDNAGSLNTIRVLSMVWVWRIVCSFSAEDCA